MLPFGLAQLKKLKIFLKLRNRNFNLHKKFFDRFNYLFIAPKVLSNIKTNFLAYPIILKKNKLFNRKKLQIFLEKNNIQTRPIFSGNILRHPAFSNIISKKNRINKFKNSDYIMKNGILIGCHQGLSLKDINFVHRTIEKFIKK